MNILSRRVEVERVLAIAQGQASDVEKRGAVWMALDAAAAEGGKEMTFLAAAAVLLAGGTLELTPAVLAGIPSMGALSFTVHQGTITVTTEQGIGPDLLQSILQAAGARAGEAVRVDAPQPELEGDTFPAAAPEEPPHLALVRFCNAVRLLLQRRYHGEMQARGHGFMVAVFGELLSMAIGIELANCQDPEQTLAKRCEQLTDEMSGRIAHYQHVSEQQQAATETEPGASTPPNPTRLM